ncbi:hypothetical protein, partial [Escherichia coli]
PPPPFFNDTATTEIYTWPTTLFPYTTLFRSEKNQYSILWVEHQDKGRLELNFVIPNMELQTGKRLQP